MEGSKCSNKFQLTFLSPSPGLLLSVCSSTPFTISHVEESLTGTSSTAAMCALAGRLPKPSHSFPLFSGLFLRSWYVLKYTSQVFKANSRSFYRVSGSLSASVTPMRRELLVVAGAASAVLKRLPKLTKLVSRTYFYGPIQHCAMLQCIFRRCSCI